MTPFPMPAVVASACALALGFFACVALDASGARKHTRTAALAGIILALLALPLAVWEAAGGGTGAFGSPLLSGDAFSLFFAALSLIVSLCVALAAKERTGAYHASVLLVALGMVLAAASRDLVMLYLSLELVTASSYVLIAYGKARERMEAAVKYFVMSLLASALMLLGIGLLIVLSGTSSIAGLAPALMLASGQGPVLLLAIGALVAGLGFKLGIFPFNFWMPDVYQASEGPVAGLLAGAGKKAGLAALLLVGVAVGAAVPQWRIAMAALAAITMTLPTLIALVQEDARRLVGYSIMAHAGMQVMALALLSHDVIAGALALAMALALAACGAFIALGVLAARGITRLGDLRGEGIRNPLLGTCLTACLLSLAGIPLFAGFAGKLALFTAAAQDGALWLVALAVLNTLLGLYYYFLIVRSLYSGRAAGKPHALARGVVVALLICAALSVLLGVYPAPLYEFAQMAAGALL